jgi:hypothetical protein
MAGAGAERRGTAGPPLSLKLLPPRRRPVAGPSGGPRPPPAGGGPAGALPAAGRSSSPAAAPRLVTSLAQGAKCRCGAANLKSAIAAAGV